MLLKILGIRPEDRRDTLVAFGLLTAMLVGHALLETARDALFLAKLDADRLPLAYIAIAGLALAVGAANRRALAKYSARRALSASLIVGAVVTVVFWFVLAGRGAWALGAFYVWVGLFATVVVTQFWLQLGEVFDVAQAKRVFSIVGAGGLVGATLGSLAASALLTAFDARVLLVAGAAAFGVAAIAPFGFSKPPDRPAPRRRGAAAPKKSGVLSNPYLVRLFAVAIVSAVLITGVDYLFKATVAANTDPKELGSFFARFYAVLNAVSLAVQLAIAPRLLRALGVNRTLLVLPGLLLFGSVGFAFAAGLIPALILKGADGAFRHSLNRTSTEILYLPLSSDVRARFKSFVDAAGQRGGQALASVVLLGAAFLGAEHVHIAIALAGLGVVWLLVVRGLEPHYLELFRRQLREGKIETQVGVPDLDLHSLEALIAALSADNDDEVIAALDMFATFEKTHLIPALILYHPSRVVVMRAFEHFSATDRADVLRLARRMLDHDDPEIRAAALRVFASNEGARELLAEHVGSDHPELRAVSLAWQARHGFAEDDEIRAGLEPLVRSEEGRDRAAVTFAVRDLPPERFGWVAVELASNANVVQAPRLAQAMAASPAPEYVRPLIGLLSSRAGRGAARTALVSLGDTALEALGPALADDALPRAVRLHIPRTISRFGTRAAAKILLDHLDHETDDRIVFKMLRGLGKMRRDDDSIPVDASALFVKTRQCVEQAIRALFWHLCLERYLELMSAANTHAASLLLQIARERERFALSRMFRYLHIIEPTDDFKMIFFGLKSEDAKTRATSRELLSHVVQPPLRDVILHMVDDISDRERLRAVRDFYDPPLRARFSKAASDEYYEEHPSALRSIYAGVLREMLDGASETLDSVVRYHLDELGLTAEPPPETPSEVRRRTVAERAKELLDVRRLEPAGSSE